MKKLVLSVVAGMAMTLCAEQNAVSRQIAATYAGKTAVITGAASGMGLCTSKTLAAAGATVVMVDIDCGRLAMGRQATTGGFLENKAKKSEIER